MCPLRVLEPCDGEGSAWMVEDLLLVGMPEVLYEPDEEPQGEEDMSDEWESQPVVWKYRPEWPNYNAFDFGFSNPWVCLDLQMTYCEKIVKKVDEGEGPCGARVFVLWREYYKRELTIGSHILNLKARKNPSGYAVQCGFGDAAAPGDVEELGKNWCPMMALPEAKQDFRRGVQEVQSLLKPMGCPGPHFFMDPSCVNTKWEFENYRWPKKIDAEEAVNEGKPEKRADNSMDALRYLVMHLCVLGMQYHLADVYRPSTPAENIYDYSPEVHDLGERTLFPLSGVTAW